jgi:hypothetical protein
VLGALSACGSSGGDEEQGAATAKPAAPGFGDHLEPLGGGVLDTDPMIAWLRYWIYGDESERNWFFGPSCMLCGGDWTDIQPKNHDWGR